MNKTTIAIVAVIVTAITLIVIAVLRKTAVKEPVLIDAEELSPSQKIERAAAVEPEKEAAGESVWDYIGRYTQRREERAAAGQTSPAEAEEAVREIVPELKDDDVAKAVSTACPVVDWEVEYFDKNTRQWEKTTVKAVTSTEAISQVEPYVDGGLFSADKSA